MDREQQDNLWASFLKEAREEIRKQYSIVSKNPQLDKYDSVYLTALENIFGKHNLTSDTEPSELLYVERKKVQEMNKRFLAYQKESSLERDIDFYKGEQNALVLLFGDKCLPDKESNEDSFAKSEPSVQGEPFSIGDKVRVTGIEGYAGEVTEIIAVDKSDPITPYKLDLLDDEEGGIWCDGNAIEPYTESKPKFKVGDKVSRIGYPFVYEVVEYSEQYDSYVITPFGQRIKHEVMISASELEPYTEPETKEDAPRPHKYSVGQKVLNHYCKSEILTISGLAGHANKNNPRYRVLDSPFLWNECELDPYTEPSNVSDNDTKDDTKDNMEEEELGKEDNFPTKELNLCELLEDYKVDSIYSVVHDAEVDFKLSNGYIEFMGLSFYSNGSMYDVAGRCMLYPSRALYEKYPLDPYSAWMEWKEARKPKRWTPKNGEKFWHLNEFMNGVSSFYNEYDFDDYTMVKTNNCFQSYELCQQAAEAVKECLEKFHKDHIQP